MSAADNAGSLRSRSSEGRNWRRCIFDPSAEMRDGAREPPRRSAEMDGRGTRLRVGMPVMITCGSRANTRVLARMRDTAERRTATHENRRLLKLFKRIIENKQLQRFLRLIDNQCCCRKFVTKFMTSAANKSNKQ